MEELLRFNDFKQIRLVTNRPTLKRWQNLKVDPFPLGIQLGPNSVAWKKSEVLAWIERRQRSNSSEAA